MRNILTIIMVVLLIGVPCGTHAAQTDWNNGDSGTVVRTALQANDTELYGTKADLDGTDPIVTTDTVTASSFISDFIDGFAGIFWDDPNTIIPTETYGIYPYAGRMYKIEDSVHSLMDAGGGSSVVEVADTPEGWEMIPGTLYIAQDDGELSFLLADSSEVFRYAATTSSVLYTMTLSVVSDGSITINGTAYTSVGSPYTITALTGATSMTAAYGGLNDTLVWSGADSGDVTGTYPTYSITVGADKTIIGTFSLSGCTYTYGSELYIVENAVIPSASDFNVTTGWINSGVSDLSSSAIDPDLGTYHISGTADSLNDDFYTDYGSLLVEGTTYRLNIRQRHSGTGDDWVVGLGATTSPALLTQAIPSTQTTYNDYNAYFIYNEDILGTIVYRENNVANDGTVYVDNFTITEITNMCTGADLNSDANATSITNETDATTGFTNAGCDVFDSISTDTPAVGTYHIESSANVTPTAIARIYKDLESDFALVEGTRYFIEIYAKHVGTGGVWNVGLGANNQTSTDMTMFILDSTDTTYKKVGLSFTYEAKYRYLVAKENSATNDGGVFIDGFSIKELEDE